MSMATVKNKCLGQWEHPVMSRLPPLQLDEMSTEQREVYNELMAAYKGRVAGTHLT